MLNTFPQLSHDALPSAAPRQAFAKRLNGFVQGGILPGLDPICRAHASAILAEDARTFCCDIMNHDRCAPREDIAHWYLANHDSHIPGQLAG